jgi:predicted metal-dependent enzyme (double-stranded beta helix superfamily)
MARSVAVATEEETKLHSPLVELASSCEAACDGPMDALQGRVLDALARAARAPDLLTPAQRTGRADAYTRHLLHGDPRGRFAIVAIVWQPGQGTPVHSHYTWCGYAVVEGSLQESSFLWTPGEGAVRRGGKVERRAGYACFGFAGIDGVHGLANRSGAPSISVHVYGVDAPRVATHVNRVLAVVD